jgi:divalent metal cation (Fe/Co/Zn/Cd) transporter
MRELSVISGGRPAISRERLVRRSVRLNVATLAYNSLEGIIAIAAGSVAGSIALVGFGLDSFIELVASVTALWRLSADVDPRRRERAERVSLRVIGLLFLALAAYVAADAGRALVTREAPSESVVGIALAALSVVVMPLLARAKRGVALEMRSQALAAEAKQTSLLAGLALNAVAGWWWADPVAGLAMVPIIAREGIAGLKGKVRDECCGVVADQGA